MNRVEGAAEDTERAVIEGSCGRKRHARDAGDEPGDFDPGVAAQAALGDAVGARGRAQQRLDVRAPNPLHGRAQRALAVRPDLLGAKHTVQVAVTFGARCSTRDRARRSLTSAHRINGGSTPSPRNPSRMRKRPRRVAEVSRGGEFEDVEARVVGDQFCDRLRIEVAHPASATRCARFPAARRAGCPRRGPQAVPPPSVVERHAALLQPARNPRRAACRARRESSTTSIPCFSNSPTQADFWDFGSSSTEHEQHGVGGRLCRQLRKILRRRGVRGATHLQFDQAQVREQRQALRISHATHPSRSRVR